MNSNNQRSTIKQRRVAAGWPKALPKTLPVVEHWVEVLMLPVRWVPAHEPFAIDAVDTHAVCAKLDELAQRGGPWKRQESGLIHGVDLNGEQIEIDDSLDQHFQALNYFHPALRNVLFGSATVPKSDGQAWCNDYMRSYARDDVQHVTAAVQQKTNGVLTVTVCHFKVLRCELALFEPGLGVLQLELLACIEPGKPWPLTLVQQLRDELRRARAPYVDTWPELWPRRGGHCALAVDLANKPLGVGYQVHGAEQWALERAARNQLMAEEPRPGDLFSAQPCAGVPNDVEQMPLFAHFRQLLGDAQKFGGAYKLVLPTDDRMPTLSFLAVDDPSAIDRGNWVRLGLVDGPGNDRLPYAEHSLREFEQRHCYDRFWHAPQDSSDLPSRIINCGYGFSMVGSSKDPYFFLNTNNGAWVTFRQIYCRMGLVAHFQKLALDSALSRMAAVASRDGSGQSRDYSDERMQTNLKQFYEGFLEFTQVYWFEELSPQLQGQELFSMWQRELRTPALYAEVRQELKDLLEYVDARSTVELAASSRRLARVAAWVGGLGVVAGLLGMNILPLENGKWKSENYECIFPLGDCNAMSANGWLLMVFSLMTLAVGLASFYWPKIKDICKRVK